MIRTKIEVVAKERIRCKLGAMSTHLIGVIVGVLHNRLINDRRFHRVAVGWHGVTDQHRGWLPIGVVPGATDKMFLVVHLKFPKITHHTVLLKALVRYNIKAIVQHATGQGVILCAHPAQHGV